MLAAGFAALVAGAGIHVDQTLTAVAIGEFDAVLQSKARALASLTDQEAGKIEFDYTKDFMPEFERKKEPEYFQFWLDDGMALMRSRRLKEDLPRMESSAESEVYDVALPDGRPGRAVQLVFRPTGPDDPLDDDEDASGSEAPGVLGLILVVACGRERLDLLLAPMRWALFGGSGLAVILAVLLVWRVLAVGFRPIDEMAQQVGAMDADGLSSRVELAVTPREIAPIADQLNALLSRLDGAFQRERRFTGNVAHELRTPIAELRSLAAVGGRWPDDKVAVVRFFRDVDEIADRMEGVIADLLLLARCQAGIEPMSRAPVRIAELVAPVLSELAKPAAARGLRFYTALPPGLIVDSDPGKLAILIGNLLRNAVSHAQPDSEIRCVAQDLGASFRLEINNSAAPLSAEDLGHLTEPFWRADEARSSDEHAGLGLSLVSALGQLLGLAVRFDQDADGTFRARVEGLVRVSNLSRSEPLRPTGSS